VGVLRDSGSTNFSIPALGGTERPRDLLLEAVQDAAAGEYEVFGEIGRGEGGAMVYLARDLVDKNLVVLRLTSGRRADDYFLEVVKRLDESVPAPESICSGCGKPLRQWGRFCTMCGADLWGDPAASGEYSRDELLQAVQEASKGKFEILGEMPRVEGGGFVYFGRDLATGKLSALRLIKEGQDEYSLGQTGVLKRIATSTDPPTPVPSTPTPPPPTPPPPKTPTPEPFPLESSPVELSPIESFPSTGTPRGPRLEPRPAQRPVRSPEPAYYDVWEQVRDFVQQPVVLAIIAVAVVVVLVSLCVAITPGRTPGPPASLGSPSQTESPEAAEEPVSLASELREEVVLGYSVAVASFRTLEEAMASQRELAGSGTPLYVAPTYVRGSVYYRLFAAMLSDRARAEDLMSQLVAAGVKDAGRDWDVRPTRLAFHFGTYPTERSADAELARLIGYGIPAYKVPAASACHVYAGGYEYPEEARYLERQLARAGIDADLTDRVGMAPP
jgi:hypothetical protein